MSLNRKQTSTSSTSLNKLGLASQTKSNTLKSRPKTKPVWDSTNSDLKQLKASQDELEKRRQIHISKNVDLIKFEKQQQLMHSNAKKTKDPKAQLALLKEILYDDEQLKSLIHKSDSTLKTVQDFFNLSVNSTSQKTKQAKINMTLAPNLSPSDLNESAQLPYTINNNDYDNNKKNNNNNIKKQQAILTKAKINNVNDTSSLVDESELIDLKLMQAKTANDTERYRHLLDLKQIMIEKKLNEPTLSKQTNNTNSNDLDECIQILNSNSQPTDADKINRIKALIQSYAQHQNQNRQEQVHKQSNQSMLSNLNDEFKRNLNELEAKLVEFESDSDKKKYSTGSNFTCASKLSTSSSSSSTCTQTLIRVSSALIDHLKEVRAELNYEKLVNSETTKQLDIHRKLIDGLTNEILCVKEQNEKLTKDLQSSQTKLESELEMIREHLLSANLGSREPPLLIDSVQAASRPSAFKTRDILPSQPSRPMSCIGYLNSNSNLNDRFTERINAMLQNDLNNVRAASTLVADHGSGGNMSSSFFSGSANNSHYLANNKHLMNDFNAQISELNTKNMQAQIKLKTMQEPDSRDFALEKLKKEQQLIKEQINLLNKQRESAQIELEVLSFTNSSASNKGLLNSNHNHNQNNNNNNKRSISNNTPSLSPISLTDNGYSDSVTS